MTARDKRLFERLYKHALTHMDEKEAREWATWRVFEGHRIAERAAKDEG